MNKIVSVDKKRTPKKKKRLSIPSVFTIPSEDQELIGFMQECRERTTGMKNEEKCEHCKLRFRCYTEIKVEKKKRRNIRIDEVVDDVFINSNKPYSKKKVQGGITYG